MDVQHLVTMSNQIGSFFDSMKDRDEAVEQVALHLKRFWEPRMRQALLRYFREDGKDLLPIVTDALNRHQSTLA
jgi:formate dehydrogenase subunit delta